MRPRFVEVPAERLESFLRSKGFERKVQFREIVYERKHEKDPSYVVKVYTSIRESSTFARPKGADAIRVCAIQIVHFGKTRGVARLPKVLRTGSVDDVLARVLERMRTAYARCNEAIKRDRPRVIPRSEELRALNPVSPRAFDPVREKHHPGAVLASDYPNGVPFGVETVEEEEP